MIPYHSSPCRDYNSKLSDCKQINGIFFGHPKIINEAVRELIEAVKEQVEAVRVRTLLVQDIKLFVVVKSACTGRYSWRVITRALRI
jgi:hypothetical protein